MDEALRKSISKKLVILGLLIFALILVFAGYKLSLWGDPVGGLESTLGKTEEPEKPVPSFSVHFIDVGQGDAALIKCDGKTMLIDAGENGNEQKMMNYLRSEGVEKFDYVVATHPHTDHIGALPEMIESFGADTVIMARIPEKHIPTSVTFGHLIDSVKASGAKVVEATAGSVFQLGSASFEIIAPVLYEKEKLNDLSIVIKLKYGETSFLFSGDAEKDEETDILMSGADIDCDVLKAGHHGSGSSSTEEFLATVTPAVCVISCGANNDYGHPHEDALQRFSQYTDKVYRTDLNSDIVIRSDGKELTVEYGNR